MYADDECIFIKPGTNETSREVGTDEGTYTTEEEVPEEDDINIDSDDEGDGDDEGSI